MYFSFSFPYIGKLLSKIIDTKFICCFWNHNNSTFRGKRSQVLYHNQTVSQLVIYTLQKVCIGSSGDGISDKRNKNPIECKRLDSYHLNIQGSMLFELLDRWHNDTRQNRKLLLDWVILVHLGHCEHMAVARGTKRLIALVCFCRAIAKQSCNFLSAKHTGKS